MESDVGATGVARNVAWTESRLLGARWLHVAGERRAVFRQLGILAADEIRAFQDELPERAALSRWLAGQRGRATFERLRAAAERDYPDVLAELEAMASGAGADFDGLLLANLRGDIGAPDGTGCSDLAIAGPRSFIGHNEDGAPALTSTFMFVTLAIEGEPSVTAQWYPGFIPSNTHSVTSTGLVWGINHIQVFAPIEAPGRHFLARRLQSAKTLDDAVTWLCSVPTAGGFAYTIGEFGSGRVVVVEAAAGQSVARWVDQGAAAWHTNHLRWLPADIDLTDDPPADTYYSHALRADSEARGDHLATRVTPGEPNVDWFLDVLAKRPLPHGVRGNGIGADPMVTLMTTVAALQSRQVTLHSAAGERADMTVEDYLRLSERGAMAERASAFSR